MAAEQHGAEDFDMTAHRQTWSGFVRLLRWSIAGIIVLLLIALWANYVLAPWIRAG